MKTSNIKIVSKHNQNSSRMPSECYQNTINHQNTIQNVIGFPNSNTDFQISHNNTIPRTSLNIESISVDTTSYNKCLITTTTDHNLNDGDIIYIKGSRGMKMEEIIIGLQD